MYVLTPLPFEFIFKENFSLILIVVYRSRIIIIANAQDHRATGSGHKPVVPTVSVCITSCTIS